MSLARAGFLGVELKPRTHELKPKTHDLKPKAHKLKPKAKTTGFVCVT